MDPSVFPWEESYQLRATSQAEVQAVLRSSSHHVASQPSRVTQEDVESEEAGAYH